MWRPFNPNVNSVVFAFNCSPVMDTMLVGSLMANKPCDYHASKLTGSFKGMVELSYQIDKRAIEWTSFINKMHRFEQEMILVIKDGLVYALVRDNNYYMDNLTKPVGKFVEVSEVEAGEDYTFCQETGKYYIIEVCRD